MIRRKAIVAMVD